MRDRAIHILLGIGIMGTSMWFANLRSSGWQPPELVQWGLLFVLGPAIGLLLRRATKSDERAAE